MLSLPRFKIFGSTTPAGPFLWFDGLSKKALEHRRLDTADPFEALANVDLSQAREAPPPSGLAEMLRSLAEALACFLAAGALLFAPEIAARMGFPVSGGFLQSPLTRILAGVLVFALVFVLRTQIRIQRRLYPSPKELFQKFTAQLPGMVYQCRVSPTGHTTLTYANDAIRWIYEKDPAAMRRNAEPILDLVHPDDRQRIWRSLVESNITLKPWNEEYRVVLPEQGVRWRLAHALVERMPDGGTLWHGFIADVTAQKRAERAMQFSEEQLALATKAAGVGVWEHDIATGRLVLNEVLYDLLQANAQTFEPTMDFFLSRVHPDDQATLREKILAHYESGGTFEHEFRIARLDGAIRHFVSNGILLRDENGRPMRAVGTNIDVTEARLAAEEMARARKAAEAAVKARGDFLAMMSHEIRTPMNGVLGCASLLKDSPLTAGQLSQVRAIETSGESLLVLINDLLDFAKIESGKLETFPEEFAIRPFLENIHLLHKAKADKKHLAYSLRLDPGLPEAIFCDRVRLGQILNNLVGNAVKFTAKGSVQLSVQAVPVKNSANLWTWHFAVKDTGPGIATNTLPKIFEEYYQAGGVESRAGTGLGLAIAMRLAKLLNGTIEVQSWPGAGSEFLATVCAPGTLILPPTDTPGARAESASLHGKRILVVDDDAISRKLCMLQLQRLGCEVDTAASGPEALEKCRSFHFDALLMDIQLPGFDGWHATRKIREFETLPRTPIIALTASYSESDRLACFAAGMNDYLSKPFKLAALTEMLKKWL